MIEAKYEVYLQGNHILDGVEPPKLSLCVCVCEGLGLWNKAEKVGRGSIVV